MVGENNIFVDASVDRNSKLDRIFNFILNPQTDFSIRLNLSSTLNKTELFVDNRLLYVNRKAINPGDAQKENFSGSRSAGKDVSVAFTDLGQPVKTKLPLIIKVFFCALIMIKGTPRLLTIFNHRDHHPQ